MHMLIVVAALAFLAFTPYVQAQPRAGDAPQITDDSADADEETPRDA